MKKIYIVTMSNREGNEIDTSIINASEDKQEAQKVFDKKVKKFKKDYHCNKKNEYKDETLYDYTNSWYQDGNHFEYSDIDNGYQNCIDLIEYNKKNMKKQSKQPDENTLCAEYKRLFQPRTINKTPSDTFEDRIYETAQDMFEKNSKTIEEKFNIDKTSYEAEGREWYDYFFDEVVANYSAKLKDLTI